ncbi:MAG: filamentous hemagglutinin N-terminal domain-containing protein, partial [Selenomonas sp.]|nr:filamentous hemagglutinin N-terminal domain-containing protein [Selenomonas sp.]
MKWFTKQKRHYAALSTLVALALASSTAFAMPTGGTVTSGSLDGYSGGDLTSGASLIPTKDSIINWDSFSIAKGETLTINTMYGALLNRVTGKDISSIFGTLTQTGTKQAILVNPNGVTVGETGVINTQNMTFSTLELSDDDFLGNKQLSWTTPDGKSVAAPIKFEKGATVTETRAYGDTAYESELDFYGGTIEVADDVTFT